MRVRGRRRRGARSDAGYIAAITVILTPVIFGLSAFTVDVGVWYVTADSIQRGADAAALAGVTYMPGNLPAAKQQALATAAANGFTSGVDPQPVAGDPAKLQVTISKTVNNTFGILLGVSQTTITRTAIANFQAPLPMGSPCNAYGDGPEPTSNTPGQTAPNNRSGACSGAGKFWANVGSPQAPKSNGDAYQDNNCAASAGGTDSCSGGNTDYSTNGYLYAVKISQPVSDLTIEAFDAGFTSEGDLCDNTNFGSGATDAVKAKNHHNYDPRTSAAQAAYLEDDTLYARGQSSAYCTGDQLYAQTNQPPDTTYTIRQPVASSNPWDPMSYPAIGSCTKTFTGFTGSLYTALNEWTQTSASVVTYTGTAPDLAATGAGGYQDDVAKSFRQWTTLCTIPGTVAAGTYFIQVQTNAAGDNPNGDGHNRFSLRAFGSSGGDKDNISISGYTNMAMYSEQPSAHTVFYLTQVPPGAAGQILLLRFFDIGDSTQPGTVQIIPPPDSNVSSFTGCVGTGPTTGALTNCSITANSSYNGKWQSISVPIPAGYTCNYASNTGCWITLSYDYGSGQPTDTTSWQASLEGTPVRITK